VRWGKQKRDRRPKSRSTAGDKRLVDSNTRAAHSNSLSSRRDSRRTRIEAEEGSVESETRKDLKHLKKKRNGN